MGFPEAGTSEFLGNFESQSWKVSLPSSPGSLPRVIGLALRTRDVALAPTQGTPPNSAPPYVELLFVLWTSSQGP